ncbi:glycosyltransferase family 4 protein [Bordetella sp. 02P26C-1]|uniref:glycosyltransferase family 4 protein n=1 Tax=Bordetella sp. 02P26C-1 TaxID=2683195 RepID=UPI00135627CA|nr:glycosyltransferase [Bordetella sp. 02P26C-1]MVW77970.1 glycosyltransferase [Bordetella sp. 02P26C-1]
MGSFVRDGARQGMTTGEPLRVTHVITGLGQGGAEAVLFRLATFAGQPVEHTVISLTDDGVYGERLRAAGVTVHTLGMARGRVSLSGFARLRRMLIEQRPDAVQTWMYHADLIGGIAARLAGVRAIAWGIRNSGAHLQRSSRSARLVLKLCAMLSGQIPAAIVCAARDSAVRHEQYGYRADRMTVIANGYDLSRYQPDAQARQRMRLRWQVSDTTPVIGCVARWDPLKDHGNLLGAMALLVQRYQPRADDGVGGSITTPHAEAPGHLSADIHCALIGRGMTPDNAGLRAMIERLGLGDRVLLLGPSDDVPAVMNALDIHVLSSCAEGFPNVVAEAMACGTPCVVTDVGDAAHIVGQTAPVVPPENAQALADGIARALEDITVRGRDAVGGPGRARVLAEFDLAHMVAQYESVWRRISRRGAKESS